MSQQKYAFTDEEFWKNYMVKWFGRDLIDFWQKHCEIFNVNSEDITLNVETFSQEGSNVPTIIFLHGIAGYARLMLPFTSRLFKLGYNVVAPDLMGYGYNSEKHGHFTWDQHVNNIIDVINWAASHFKGDLFLGGASMGGPLAYATSCISQKIKGTICWCLWDLQDPDFIKNQTNLGKIALKAKGLFKFFGKALPSLRIPAPWVIGYETLSDPNEDIDEYVLNDRLAGRKISLAGATSLMFQSEPAIKYEDYEKDLLIVHPKNDLMVFPEFSRRIYRKLKQNNKRGENIEYHEIEDCFHFPLDNKNYETFSGLVGRFISKTL